MATRIDEHPPPDSVALHRFRSDPLSTLVGEGYEVVKGGSDRPPIGLDLAGLPADVALGDDVFVFVAVACARHDSSEVVA